MSVSPRERRVEARCVRCSTSDIELGRLSVTEPESWGEAFAVREGAELDMGVTFRLETKVAVSKNKKGSAPGLFRFALFIARSKPL